ncbi:MAG: NAD(P)/FAD-dependent oxidoreductase [Deltaproteobacteria bacterium]
MQSFRTIIVGAGPGGLACAIDLARAGQEVLVLEKSQSIGPKVCAGGVTWAGIQKFLPAGMEEQLFFHQHLRSRLQSAIISAKKPILATVNRQRLGQNMLAAAREAGALVQSGTRVEEINDDRGELTAGRRKYRFQFLVYWLPGEYPWMEWHLNRHFFGSGYGWIFPHLKRTSVGVYGHRRNMLPSVLRAGLHAWMKKMGLPLKDLQPEAALINFDYRGWKFNNIFLVGDAAGLASPLTGEGIYPAVISGQAVADAILGNNQARDKLQRLLIKHRRHLFLQRLALRSRLLNSAFAEIFLLLLRNGVLQFSCLEMGECRQTSQVLNSTDQNGVFNE